MFNINIDLEDLKLNTLIGNQRMIFVRGHLEISQIRNFTQVTAKYYMTVPIISIATPNKELNSASALCLYLAKNLAMLRRDHSIWILLILMLQKLPIHGRIYSHS